MYNPLTKNVLALGIFLGIMVFAVQLTTHGMMRFGVLAAIALFAGFVMSGKIANSYLNALCTVMFSYAVANLFYAIWMFSTPLFFLLNLAISSLIFPFVIRYFDSDRFQDGTKVIVAGAALTILIPFFSVLGLYFTQLALTNMAR
jgi:hypothetical protein